jgi:hypothetical protein
VIITIDCPKLGSNELKTVIMSSTLGGFDVHGLLTRDAICRKLRKWPLLTPSEMDNILTRTKNLHSYRSSNFGRIQEEFCTTHRLCRGKERYEKWQDVEQKALAKLDKCFPYTLQLLKHFEGKIVAAGGAVFKALENWRSNDVDFFFVDPAVEHLDAKSAQLKYDDLLAEVISFLADLWLFDHRPNMHEQHANHPYARPATNNVHVQRSEFVTTVYLVSSHNDEYKYQFIHRVYPSIGSILGGFDLGPCMVATDGHRILATELGAWSALGTTMIVDTSRRSTSFEHRLRKYSYYCNLILPGLPADLSQSEGAVRLVEHEMLEELEELVAVKGYRAKSKCDFGQGYREIAQEIMRTAEFISTRTDENMIAKIERLVAENGYTLENPEEIKLHPTNVVCDVSELRESLERTAEKKGYLLDFQAFKGYVASRKYGHAIQESYKEFLADEDDSGERQHILQEKRFIFKLPYVRLNLETFHPNYRNIVTWSISPIKGRIESDYEDSVIWCTKCVATNLTMLINNRLSGIASVLIMKLPGTTIITPHADTPESISENNDEIENIRQLSCLQECAIDITKESNPASSTCITQKEAILNSFREPQFGDVENELRVRFAYNPCVFEVIDQPELVPNPEEFYTRVIMGRLEETQKKLTGVTWRLTNPGTQWTGSINPTIANPRDWYGERYKSFRIGCEGIETCLRLMRLRDGPWKILPKDIFRQIVILIVWENSFIKKQRVE